MKHRIIVMRQGIFAITAAALLAVPAFGQARDTAGQRAERHARIDARQAHQHQRIFQGVRQGDLNRVEAHRLAAGQRHIRQEERRHLPDGRLSGRERRDLHREQHQARRHVRHERHDAQGRRTGWQGHVRQPWDGRGYHDGWRDPGRGGQGWNGRQRGVSAHAAQDYNRRISAGLRSGALTPDEARSLRRELQSVRAEQRGYLADGHYSRSERSEIRSEYRDLAARIRAESRDGDRRY